MQSGPPNKNQQMAFNSDPLGLDSASADGPRSSVNSGTHQQVQSQFFAQHANKAGLHVI